jgi:hypothetical protein
MIVLMFVQQKRSYDSHRKVIEILDEEPLHSLN